MDRNQGWQLPSKDMAEIEISIKQVELLRLQPGDVLVVKCQKKASDEVLMRIKTLFGDVLKKSGISNKVIVMNQDDLELQVIRDDTQSSG